MGTTGGLPPSPFEEEAVSSFVVAPSTCDTLHRCLAMGGVVHFPDNDDDVIIDDDTSWPMMEALCRFFLFFLERGGGEGAGEGESAFLKTEKGSIGVK